MEIFVLLEHLVLLKSPSTPFHYLYKCWRISFCFLYASGVTEANIQATEMDSEPPPRHLAGDNPRAPSQALSRDPPSTPLCPSSVFLNLSPQTYLELVFIRGCPADVVAVQSSHCASFLGWWGLGGPAECVCPYRQIPQAAASMKDGKWERKKVSGWPCLPLPGSVSTVYCRC